MSKKFLLYSLTLGCLVAILAPAVAQAQVCAPLDNGRVADPFYEGTVIFWDPVVEFRTMTLTISGPCEDIVRTFTPKDQVMFDIREIERIVDGQYTWTLKREASIDPGLQKKLQEARFSGEEDDLWWDAFQAGKIPAGPYTDSGTFTVERGQIIDPNSGEEKSATLAGRGAGGASSAITATVAGGLASGEPSGEPGSPVLATKDTVLTNANGVIRNSLCVGFDCLNNNTYSDTTIMLTENNTRIKFDDTSAINSFPRNDWEIEANSSLNGGASYLGFNDCGQSSGGGCASDLVFAVEAGVRQHALYVESDGDVGLGTSNPVVRLHMIDGDTPALRLEQDGSSGFQPQVWDVAGNETNFFVRDATGGSTLPFRIQPGGAPSSSIHIRNTGNVGIGTSSATQPLHVRRSDGSAKVLVEEASSTEAARELAHYQNNGTVTFRFTDTQGTASAADDFNWIAGLRTNNQFIITLVGTIASPLWSMDSSGNVTATSFNPTSSRELKEGFEAVDAREVLARLSELPIAEWQYRDDVSGARHIGPTAEDFKAAFGLNGPDEQHLSLTDLSGVALVAIQGLHQEIETKDDEIARLEEDNRELSDRLEALERLVASLALSGE